MTISILRGLKEKYELHHGISISDKAIISAVMLSDRYIANKNFQIRQLILIDEAASKRKIELKSKPEKAQKLRMKIIKNKIEIESLKNDKDDSKKELNIEEENLELTNNLNIILKEWKSYEEKIKSLNALKENLDRKMELKSAERQGDYNQLAN